jgi:hypothetical protein
VEAAVHPETATENLCVSLVARGTQQRSCETIIYAFTAINNRESQMSALFLKRDRTGEGLYAARSYHPGEFIFQFEAVSWRPIRDRHTVEHPFGGHFFHPILAKTSHGCEPNCRISFSDRAMVALKAVAAGEAISFDYQSTERRISHPFDCLCGSTKCRQRIE